MYLYKLIVKKFLTPGLTVPGNHKTTNVLIQGRYHFPDGLLSSLVMDRNCKQAGTA